MKGCRPISAYARALERSLIGARLVVGYNVAFDLSFLRASGIEVGHAPVFDVMREFAPVAGHWNVWERKYAWVTLEHCARHYGISCQAHDALADAQATLHCFMAMLERGDQKASLSEAKSYLDVVGRYARVRRRERGERDEQSV